MESATLAVQALQDPPGAGCIDTSSPAIVAAYCDLDGAIHLGATVPGHMIELARGTMRALRMRLELHARRGQADGCFVVPGMPEAHNSFDARLAARCWIDWCVQLERDAVVWNRSLQVMP